MRILPQLIRELLETLGETALLSQFLDPNLIPFPETDLQNGWCASLHWLQHVVQQEHTLVVLRTTKIETVPTCLLQPFEKQFSKVYQPLTPAEAPELFQVVKKHYVAFRKARTLQILSFINGHTQLSTKYQIHAPTNFYLSIPTRARLIYPELRNSSIGTFEDLNWLLTIRDADIPKNLQAIATEYRDYYQQCQQQYSVSGCPLEVAEVVSAAQLLHAHNKPVIVYADQACAVQMLLNAIEETSAFQIEWRELNVQHITTFENFSN